MGDELWNTVGRGNNIHEAHRVLVTIPSDSTPPGLSSGEVCSTSAKDKLVQGGAGGQRSTSLTSRRERGFGHPPASVIVSTSSNLSFISAHHFHTAD